MKKLDMINKNEEKQKVIGTRTSQAVPHLSTERASRSLTSEFGWDPVLYA